MSILIIGAKEVRKLLSGARCIDAVERAMRALSAGRFDAPSRRVSALKGGHFFLMPGSMNDGPVFGAKLASLLPGNPAHGLPAVQGFVALFDHDTGSPLALVDAAAVTYLRTAAASALATRTLARHDAASHGIFGAGVLAMEHLHSIANVRPIGITRVWARSREKAERFAKTASEETGFEVLASSPEEAAACDIVTTVTNASEPVLNGHWLSPGCHLNLVGAHQPGHREADVRAVSRAEIYVDSLQAALEEAGDILIPINEGLMSAETIRGEIGQVLNGELNGRKNAGQITLYKSLGHVAQDLYAAEVVFRLAKARNRTSTACAES